MIESLEQYVGQALRSEPPTEQYEKAGDRLRDLARLMHALMGLQTEVGELLDNVKRHVYYGWGQ